MLVGEFPQTENFKRQRYFGLYFVCNYLVPWSNTRGTYLISGEKRLSHPEKIEPKGKEIHEIKCWEWKRSRRGLCCFFFVCCLFCFVLFCVINWLLQYTFKVCKSLSQKLILACAWACFSLRNGFLWDSLISTVENKTVCVKEQGKNGNRCMNLVLYAYP